MRVHEVQWRFMIPTFVQPFMIINICATIYDYQNDCDTTKHLIPSQVDEGEFLALPSYPYHFASFRLITTVMRVLHFRHDYHHTIGVVGRTSILVQGHWQNTRGSHSL